MQRERPFGFARRTGQNPADPGLIGYGIAVLAVVLCLVVRALLEGSGSLQYLAMLPAVMATALLAGRRETICAIVLTVIANLFLLHPQEVASAGLNDLFFVVVAWATCEGIWRLRAHQQHAQTLSMTLARRERMLSSILASSPIVTLDRKAVVRSLTSSASTILGAPESLAVGEAFNLFVEDFDIDAPRAQVGDGGPNSAWIARRSDGERLNLGIQMQINEDPTDPDYAFLCLTDLTQSYAADARARDLDGQLNRVWRLNSMGEMAATLSHELNQPLSAATAYLHAAQTDMTRAGPVAGSAASAIHLAKNQMLRAGEIIRRMNELLAHETRALHVERASLMLADVEGVLVMIGGMGAVEIDLQVESAYDSVRADRIQFQQAMVNLVRNAVEALAGRPDPRVVIIGKTISPDSYEIRVEDNGVGIATADMETIFRPLMSTKSGGMGLGLSVTRKIIESHGGVLRVETSPLGGAAFAFCLMRERELMDA